jgi:TPR repeat protein
MCEPLTLTQQRNRNATAQVRRWFEDTLVEAQRGDVKQQALVAQMFAEGYGCQRDLQAAAEWAEKARLRGYKMKGVSAGAGAKGGALPGVGGRGALGLRAGLRSAAPKSEPSRRTGACCV